jgi:hypothetical protein
MPFAHWSQEIRTGNEVRIEAERDTLVTTVGDSLRPAGITTIVQDTIARDTIRRPRLLTDVVRYEALDYMRMSPRENRMYLYNEAQITYEDMVITAGLIIVDNNRNEVYAYGIPDSLGSLHSKTDLYSRPTNRRTGFHKVQFQLTESSCL